jgi:hypothetical protein
MKETTASKREMFKSKTLRCRCETCRVTAGASQCNSFKRRCCSFAVKRCISRRDKRLIRTARTPGFVKQAGHVTRLLTTIHRAVIKLRIACSRSCSCKKDHDEVSSRANPFVFLHKRTPFRACAVQSAAYQFSSSAGPSVVAGGRQRYISSVQENRMTNFDWSFV